MTTPWPKNNGTLPIEDLVRPVVAALLFAYKVSRMRAYKDVPWSGPECGDDVLANTPPIAERFKAENLRYSLVDQGRDAMNEIVTAAIQIGIEQGRRITLTGDEYKTLTIQAEVGRLLIDAAKQRKEQTDGSKEG